MNAEQVPALAVAASQIGPDFYAVLLITVVAVASGGLLLRAQKSVPSLSVEQLRPYRLFFYLACIFGMATITVSIGWWIYKQTHGIHTFQIAITNVAPNIKIDSRYFSKTTFRLSQGDGALIADEYFLVVSERPFVDGDSFIFDIFVVDSGHEKHPLSCASAGGATRKESVKVPFSGQMAQSFTLELDEASQPSLKLVTAPSGKSWFSQEEMQVAQLMMEVAR